MIFKYLTILLLLIVFQATSTAAKAQCSNGIALLKKEISSKGQGQLKLKVDANGIFEGKLIELNGDLALGTEKFSGNGDGTFNFKHLNLNPEHTYKVEVDFLSEDKFLCKKRVLIDIQFSDN